MERDTVNLLTTAAGAIPEHQANAVWEAMLREASDPVTPAERLTTICITLPTTQNRYATPVGAYTRARQSVLAAIAANPNTPLDLLGRLAPLYPAAFCQNPAAPLALLEDPGFARRLWRKRPLLRCADLPLTLAEQLEKTTSSPRLREEMRLHVVVGGELANHCDAFEAVRDYWRGYAKSARRGRREQARLVELAALDLLPTWAADPVRTAHLRAQLIMASDLTLAPLALAELLWTTDSWLVRLAVGLNPNTDSEDRAAVESDLIRRYLYGRCWKRIAHACRPKKGEGDDTAAQRRILNACRVAACFPRRNALAVRIPKVERQIQRLRGGDTADCIWGGQYIAESGADLALWRFVQLIAPKTSAQDKKRAARSLRWQERLGAACGLDPRYPRSEAALATLTEDGNSLVRAAARARLADPETSFLL